LFRNAGEGSLLRGGRGDNSGSKGKKERYEEEEKKRSSTREIFSSTLDNLKRRKKG